MKVLVLGAGASVSSGYPLTVDLLEEVQNRIKQRGNSAIREQWGKWEEFKKQSKGLESLILNTRNPEVALTILDLAGFSLQDNVVRSKLESSIRDHDQAFQEVWGGNSLSPESCPDEEIRHIFEVSLIRNPLRQCLSWYFSQRHAEDKNGNFYVMRNSLRDLLSNLETGDVVITFNWDTIVERELGSKELWNPVTGYGINFKLDSSPPSSIRVLKPHGSVGWRRLGSESMFMDEEFLQEFNSGFEKESWFRTISPENIKDFENMTRSLFEYPTFLKETGHRAYLDIWSDSLDALARAEKVDIWGYSLPTSDSAAVVLMTSLIGRLQRARVIPDVQITIHDPSEETRNRWRDFFGLTFFSQGVVDLKEERL